MEEDKLIHVKFEYLGALESKKDILNLEKDLIILRKKMNEYYSSRINELNLKVKFYRKIKEVADAMKRLQKNLPTIDAPKEIKKRAGREASLKVFVNKKEVKKRNDGRVEGKIWIPYEFNRE